MRIIHVITRLIVGGAQENTLLSCEGQHARGHDVTLITGPAIGPEGSLLQRAQSFGYKVEIIDEMRRAILPLKDYKTYRILKRRFRELQPDIVHTHSSKAGIIGRWAAHHAEVSGIVHTIHGLAFTASTSPAVNNAYKVLERITAPITHKIICVADAMRDQSIAADIGKPEQYVTVYSGMETQSFLHPPVAREEVRKQLGLEPHHIAVGTIARLFHLKGHDDILDIAPTLCSKFPHLRFLWIGDGILREQFESRMREMNLHDRFILTGLVPPTRIPELTNAMDILLHPSRREGLARAIPQGQLAGCPAIAYNIDGNIEGMIPNETGFIIKPFEKQELADRLSHLLENPDLRASMGNKGRQFALQRFDAPVMVNGLDRVYSTLIRQK